jgi:hypothetical protein
MEELKRSEYRRFQVMSRYYNLGILSRWEGCSFYLISGGAAIRRFRNTSEFLENIAEICYGLSAVHSFLKWSTKSEKDSSGCSGFSQSSIDLRRISRVSPLFSLFYSIRFKHKPNELKWCLFMWEISSIRC